MKRIRDKDSFPYSGSSGDSEDDETKLKVLSSIHSKRASLKSSRNSTRSEASSIYNAPMTSNLAKMRVTDLESLEHAMVSLAKYFDTLLNSCNEICSIDLDNVESPPFYNNDQQQAEVINQNADINRLITRPRIKLARKIKIAYNDGKLPFIDNIISLCAPGKVGSHNNTNHIPSTFLFDIGAGIGDGGASSGTGGGLSRSDKKSLAKTSKLSKKAKKSSESASGIDDNTNSPPQEKQKTWPPALPEITDKELESQVFTHKSVPNEKHYLTKKEMLLEHNERLEFIGDAVINFVISNLVYEHFPDASEGDLSSMRSLLICNDTLWDWATMYELDKKLKTKFDIYEMEGKKSKIVADTMEAYVGGLYLDPKQGPSAVKEWICELVGPMISELNKQREADEPIDKEAKQLLYVQIGSQDLTPEYVTVIEGDNHRGFTVECKMGTEVIGVGTGANIKNAGLRAAMMALRNTAAIEKFSEIRRQTPRTAGYNNNNNNIFTSSASTDYSGQTSPSTYGGNIRVIARDYSPGDKSSPEAPGVSSWSEVLSGNGSGKASRRTTNTPSSSGPKDELYSRVGSAEHRPIYDTRHIGGNFLATVKMHTDVLGNGQGRTKKEAELKAAEDALKNDRLMSKWIQQKKRLL